MRVCGCSLWSWDGVVSKQVKGVGEGETRDGVEVIWSQLEG